jgi:DNA-binding HxlR family transcriptional regulator
LRDAAEALQSPHFDTHRFSELRRKVEGMSEKMLAHTLQALEADGFILRKAYPVIPPRWTMVSPPWAAKLRNRVEENLPRVAQARAIHGRAKKSSSLNRTS